MPYIFVKKEKVEIEGINEPVNQVVLTHYNPKSSPITDEMKERGIYIDESEIEEPDNKEGYSAIKCYDFEKEEIYFEYIEREIEKEV